MSHDEDDELDGCELDFSGEAVDADTERMLPLFPQGADTPDFDKKKAYYDALAEELAKQVTARNA